MLAATYAFGVMFLAFGVVPHQWIDHADKNLGWSKDKIIYGPGGILKPQALGRLDTRSRCSTRRSATSSSSLIHVVFFGLIIFMWGWWQKRGQVTHRPRSRPARYGRPLVKKA